MNRLLKSRILGFFDTQADFAEKIGVSESLVSRVIRGRRRVSIDVQLKWARALKCASRDIFRRE